MGKKEASGKERSKWERNISSQMTLMITHIAHLIKEGDVTLLSQIFILPELLFDSIEVIIFVSVGELVGIFQEVFVQSEDFNT